MKKNLLITGGAGFIGSNFINYFLHKYPEYKIINLDKLTYAGNLANTVDFKDNSNYFFIKGDIKNKTLLEKIFWKHNINGVIHFAAESHVDNSIANPQTFLETNIIGTFCLINTAYTFWKEKKVASHRFYHISTDEVYGSLDSKGFFTETTAYAPNSPYSASKASSDFIVRSFNKTYGLNTVISSCSNNYGPNQHPEKLIPTVIRNALADTKIPIYGDGKNIRDWIYVLDHCKAIDLIYHKGNIGETYNIGAQNELNNLDLAYKICAILDKLKPKKIPYQEQIQFVEDRAGHDRRYAVDSSKLKKELGWQVTEKFENRLTKAIKWYINLIV